MKDSWVVDSVVVGALIAGGTIAALAIRDVVNKLREKHGEHRSRN